VLLERAMREVEATDVDTGLEEGVKGLDGPARRAHGGDNFGSDHKISVAAARGFAARSVTRRL
jgi:hypothetical protein